MEALFSSSHVDDVGVWVVGGYRGGWFRHLMVSRTCSAWEVDAVAKAQEQKKTL